MELCLGKQDSLQGVKLSHFDSVEMAVVDTWGYKVNGSWTGIAGYLQRGKADIGATALYITESRLSVLTYIAGTTRTR